MNLFEYAARHKLRFSSVKGDLTAEQLFDLPLRSRDDFNLDAVARAANRALKAVSEESFVDTAKTEKHTRLEATFALVKFVIEAKIAEEAAAEQRKQNKAEKEKLLQILAEKQDGKLSALSESELKKRIAALGD
jgi:hypothetical protein